MRSNCETLRAAPTSRPAAPSTKSNISRGRRRLASRRASWVVYMRLLCCVIRSYASGVYRSILRLQRVTPNRPIEKHRKLIRQAYTNIYSYVFCMSRLTDLISQIFGAKTTLATGEGSCEPAGPHFALEHFAATAERRATFGRMQ